MVKLTIDGRTVEVSEGTTILEAAKTVGINIPTLCYFEKLNDIGACRVCVCEVKGAEKLVAACNTAVYDGIEVLTNSPRVRAARKVNVELILSTHNCNCVACVRSGNCALQTLANDLNVRTVPYESKVAKPDWDENLPLQRDASKCISCMRCVNACDELQGLKVWEVNGSGSHTKVTVRDGLSLTEAGCAFCGQCITHCPVGALTARDDTDKVFDAIEDEETVTVMQIAPAVRVAVGEAFIGGKYGNAASQQISYGNVDWGIANINGGFAAATILFCYLGFYVNKDFMSTAPKFGTRFLENAGPSSVAFGVTSYFGSLPKPSLNEYRSQERIESRKGRFIWDYLF